MIKNHILYILLLFTRIMHESVRCGKNLKALLPNKELQIDQENRLSWAASFMYQCIILN